ncbi:MAG: Crp/Fnr family transcriptional regulator [Acidiphilium sp.]|nr:Crp/Fnr family transcriptional regulator [Acidiphilium sp.]MDD4935503.1 Crp/Fnr family transcriptional regulator [Acidiphilium sp.]
MAISQSATSFNHLLSALPLDALTRLLPKLCPVELPVRLPLYKQELAIEAVYFPTSGMISLVANLDDGMQAEVGIIGREGMLGTALLSGIDTPFVEAMVQMPGVGLRMKAHDFRHEVDMNTPFRMLLLRYNEARYAQAMQTAACNGRHGLEQRLARWLLMALDCIDGDVLPLTQEFMAMMLGVHRPSISVTAGILQRAGLIRYAGGQITVLDRLGLEAACCECYGVVKKRFSVLLGKSNIA